MNFFTYSFALVVLVAAAFAAEQSNGCPIACAAVYAPVCAQNRNGDLQTFSSICNFEAYICKNKDSEYSIFKTGECPAMQKDTQCQSLCTTEYMPVCAKNRNGDPKTFPNRCVMESYFCKNKDSGYEFVQDGECSDIKRDAQCNFMCPDEYKPVCAMSRNGEFETFPNLCQFKAFICKNKHSGFQLQNNGECADLKKDVQCNDVCTYEYKPVCAMNRDGESKTFPNVCEFEAFTCKNRDSGFQLFNNGECADMKKDAQCNFMCLDEYKPVCAMSRNGEFETFPNLCQFKAFICKNKHSGFQLQNNGECTDLKKDAQCNDVCTYEYKPVCAMNRDGESKTFPNVCEFEAFTCKNRDSGFQLFNNGECADMKKDAQCNFMCIDEYKPVCAMNRNGEFQTFSNLCYFEAFTCKTKNSGFELVKNGECQILRKSEDCPKVCPLNYLPVCGQNRNGEFTTFPNICEFKAFTCKNKDSALVLFKDGECSVSKKEAECNQICTADYQPICAKNRGNSKTFSNLCEFEAFTCKNKDSGFVLFKNGECPIVKNCPRACPMNYLPVCAKNRDGESKTFSNICEFEAFTCKNKDSGFELYQKGECSIVKKGDNCPRVCPLIMAPICAKNLQGDFQTFDNYCNFEVFTCENKKSGYEYFKEGACSAVETDTSCNIACTDDYTPVCAKNREGHFQTFANACDLDAYTCRNKNSGYQFYKAGECETGKKSTNCPIACLAVYEPICTINRDGELQSFSNFCEFEMFKCNHNESGVQYFRDAEC